MNRLTILAAGVSLLALTGCGDAVKFPGADDMPVIADTDTTPPAPPIEPVNGNNAGDTDTSDVTDVSTDPDPVTPTPSDVVDPLDPTDPTTDTDPTLPGTDTDPDTGDVVADTDTDTDGTDIADTDTSTDPDDTDTTGDTDVADTDTTTPTPGTQPATTVTDLRMINAELCKASAQQTMTVAQVANAGEPAATFNVSTVNGVAATRAAFPGIVKMEPRTRVEGNRTRSGHCGATRIANNWFITAAHCLDQKYDEVTLVTGVENLRDPNAVRVKAESTICHSAYGGIDEEYANDIALVKVSDTVAAALVDIPTVRYGRTNLPLGGSNYPTATMAGWGLTGFGESLSTTLLSAQLAINNAGPAVISIASKNGAGPCIGDSGGPLYVTEADGQKTLVGVLSVVENNLTTGEFCEGQYNGRYTNLQGFDDWIDRVIGTCDADTTGRLCK